MDYLTIDVEHGAVIGQSLNTDKKTSYQNFLKKLKNRLLYRGITRQRLHQKLQQSCQSLNTADIVERLFMYGDKGYSFLQPSIEMITKENYITYRQQVFTQLSTLADEVLTTNNPAIRAIIDFNNEQCRDFFRWFADSSHQSKFEEVILTDKKGFAILMYYYTALHQVDTLTENHQTNYNQNYPLISTTTSHDTALGFISEDNVEKDGYIMNIIKDKSIFHQLSDDAITALGLPVFKQIWIHKQECEVSLFYAVSPSRMVSVEVYHQGNQTVYVNPHLFQENNAYLLAPEFKVNKSKNIELSIDQSDFDITKTAYHSYCYFESLDIIKDSKIGESL